jgi:hypothetical protein
MKLKPNKMQQTLGFRVREPVDWEEVKGVHHLVGDVPTTWLERRVLAISRLFWLRNSNRILAHCDAVGGAVHRINNRS